MKKKLFLFTFFCLSALAFAEKDVKVTVETEKFRTFYGDKIFIAPNDSGVKITKDKIIFEPQKEGVEYTINGYFKGQIINKTKNTVLKLNKVYLENSSGEPVIYGEAKTEISTTKDTKNYVVSSGNQDALAKSKPAAIQCKKNLELGGSGTLYIVGNVYHAVKADDVKLKGSGEFYFQGTKKGSCINCENLIVEKDKKFKAYLVNSKNAVKADFTIKIQSGSFYIWNNETAFKTDTKKDDGQKNHSIAITGSAMVFTTPDTNLYETEKNAYKADGASISEQLLNYDRQL
ncbi:carbohydrate-binding domain-containing protein [Treponema sp.]|uniref:carbohydrate-binding domain-containing protein n=1 Tax=Treponema sp. TaxID=166 RepID=UPI00388F818B